MRDVLTLFVLAPLGIAIMWDFMGVCGGNARRAISMAFVLGVFLLGLGFGMHEPMLGLAVAGWDKAPGVGPSIVFFKEIPGHWAFFLGMLVTIVALVLAETASPFEKPVPRWAFLTALVSGLAGAVSLYGNEVNDQRTSIDMGVVAFCLALVLATHWRQGWTRLGRIPLTFCFYLVFGLGGAAVYATWLLRALGL
jgi:hypothetical protein